MRKAIAACLMWVAGCAEPGPRLGEQVAMSGINTRFEDGIPDPGSTWIRDPATGWGWLDGAVNFEVHNLVGDTTVFSYIRDNANTCVYCADGNSVIMMYVAYQGRVSTMVSETPSEGDGIGRYYSVQELPHPPADKVVVRYSTSYVFRPEGGRLSLVQPPRS